MLSRATRGRRPYAAAVRVQGYCYVGSIGVVFTVGPGTWPGDPARARCICVLSAEPLFVAERDRPRLSLKAFHQLPPASRAAQRPLRRKREDKHGMNLV